MARRAEYPTKFIKFRLDGKNYVLSYEDVCAKVAFVPPKPTEKYFIAISHRPYPPKQVLELALGVPSANFTTAAAIAILRRLGFEIQTTGETEVRTKTESERLSVIWNTNLNRKFRKHLSDPTSYSICAVGILI